MDASSTTSVVIVAWQDTGVLDDCLTGLEAQAMPPTKIIVVDNAADLGDRIDRWRGRLPVQHLAMGSNRGPSAARNAGVAASSGDLVLFLDDDAVPNPAWVQAYVGLFVAREIAAARGRVEPRQGRLLNELARAYDLGPDVRPSVINTEGNCAIRRSVLERVGGFNENMYGHEGTEISMRIIEEYGESAVVYTPSAVIRHDYADGVGDYLSKRFRHGHMLRHLGITSTRHAASRSVRHTDWTWRRTLTLPIKIVGIGSELAGLAWSYVRPRRIRY